MLDRFQEPGALRWTLGSRVSDATSAVREAAHEPLTLRWLVRLRWVAFATQVVILLAASQAGWVTDGRVRAAVGALIAVGVLSNAVLRVFERRGRLFETRPLLAGLLAADVVLLVSMLGVAGGPANPFTVVLLVNITLAAVTVGATWTWAIVAVALAGYSSLFLRGHVHAPGAVAADYASHLAGMWLAFVITAVGIAAFVTTLNRALTASQRRLDQLERQASRDARLAALTATVGGAAHELATPLSSIAVAAGELERVVASGSREDLLADVALIRGQVERCRTILDQMSGRASEEWLDKASPVAVLDLVSHLSDYLTPEERGRLDVDVHDAVQVALPVAGLTQSLLNLIRNAFEASPAERRVRVAFTHRSGWAAFAVSNGGAGMPREVLERAGEPFFTTKPHGHGLGLFLVRQFAERRGGRLDIASSFSGTCVTIVLPTSVAA